MNMRWYERLILTGDGALVNKARSELFITSLRRRVLASTTGRKRLGDRPVTAVPQDRIRIRINDYTWPVRSAVRSGVRRRLEGRGNEHA